MTINSSKQPLSASWRRGASQIKEVEMASALTSLKNLIGTIIPDKNVVVKYTSHNTSYFDPSTFNVRISSKPIDEAPIPSNIFDVLCGYSVHESSHILNQSDTARAFAIPSTLLQGKLLNIISQIVKIGEEIYCDRHPPAGNLGNAYIRRARDYSWEHTYEDWPWWDMWMVWLATSVFHKYPPIPDPKLAKGMAILMELSGYLWNDITPTNRGRLYHRAAEKLLPVMEELENEEDENEDPWDSLLRRDKVFNKPTDLEDDDDPDPNVDIDYENPEPQPSNQADEQEVDTNKPIESSDGPDDIEDTRDSNDEFDPDHEEETNESEAMDEITGGGTGEKQVETGEEEAKAESTPKTFTLNDLLHCPNDLAPISDELGDKIQDHVQSLTEDVTQELQSLIDNDNSDPNLHPLLNNMVTKQASSEEITYFDDREIAELEWLRNLKTSVSKQIDRGLESGIVDASRLHRSAIDSNGLFRQSRLKDLQAQDIVILVDRSRSMHTHIGGGRAIYPHIYNVWKVLRVPIYSYTEGEANSTLVDRMDNPQGIKSIEPLSGTPSGEAMLFVATRHPRSTIIHFTDGEANGQLPPTLAMEIVSKSFPRVKFINILYSKNPSKLQVLEQAYINNLRNNSVVPLQSLDNFSSLLQTHIQKTLQE